MHGYECDATYSPDDNKLRLYAARLDTATYNRVKAAGFSWAAKQQLFVAPMWTPEREDLCLELAGEIADEDKSLVERQEERAERFEGYSENRMKDAERAQEYVSSLADNVPLGQPILVGHHSERHARRNAKRIENGMRKAVDMWETSKYWEQRAQGALRHAKYKELPRVRANRIKRIEADKRRQERNRKEAEIWLKLWGADGLTLEQAQAISSRCWLTLPRKEGDKPDHSWSPTAYDALRGEFSTLYAPRTLEEIVTFAKAHYPAVIANCDRWIAHYENRLIYEKAMLEEQGASALLDKKPRPKQLPLCNYRAPGGIRVENIYQRGEFIYYPQEEMTSAEYAKIHNDYKGTRVVENSHRVRTAMIRHTLVSVFLTDSKVHEKPQAQERELPPPPMPAGKVYTPPERTVFDDMKDSLKQGVATVSAPQLFPTPPDLAARMVELADIQPGHRVLEPSAGTGNLLRAMPDHCESIAVEINPTLSSRLHAHDEPWPHLQCTWTAKDFLECNGNLGTFDRIVMNPPFQNAVDIRHILHAKTFLRPGGKLVALCANGPRQQDQLKPMADYWEDLPEGSFKTSGTNVRTALLIIEA